MSILKNKEKLVEIFLKYPTLFYSLYFLYATRSQLYIIKNIAIYDSVIHNILILWGIAIVVYNIFKKRFDYTGNKLFIITWIVSSIITIVVNLSQIRFDSVRSSILTIVVILAFIPAYSSLKEKYSISKIFKYIFYPTIIYKVIVYIISLFMYFLNISIFVMGDLSSPYTYGIRYVSIGTEKYNLLLYGTFFSPNKEVMHAIPIMFIAMFILMNKGIMKATKERVLIWVYLVLSFVVVSLCNSRGALYSIIIVTIIYIVLTLYKIYKFKDMRNKDSYKKIAIFIISFVVVLLGYSGVKKIAATVVSNVSYKRVIYDYNGGTTKRVSIGDLDKKEYEKFKDKILEYNPGVKDEKQAEKIKSEIVIEKSDSGEELGNGRISIWKETLRLYLKKPVFGIGQGMNTEIAKKYSQTEFPILSNGTAIHNSYLAVLLYQGIIGLAIIITWLGLSLLKFIKYEYTNREISYSILHFNLYFILIVSLFLDVIFLRDEFTQLMILFLIGYLHSESITNK